MNSLEDDRAETTRSALTRPRNALFDHTPAKVCIHQTALSTRHSIAKISFTDTLFTGEPLERLVQKQPKGQPPMPIIQ